MWPLADGHTAALLRATHSLATRTPLRTIPRGCLVRRWRRPCADSRHRGHLPPRAHHRDLQALRPQRRGRAEQHPRVARALLGHSNTPSESTCAAATHAHTARRAAGEHARPPGELTQEGGGDAGGRGVQAARGRLHHRALPLRVLRVREASRTPAPQLGQPGRPPQAASTCSRSPGVASWRRGNRGLAPYSSRSRRWPRRRVPRASFCISGAMACAPRVPSPRLHAHLASRAPTYHCTLRAASPRSSILRSF